VLNIIKETSINKNIFERVVTNIVPCYILDQ